MDDPVLDDLLETLIAWTHQTVGDAEIIKAREAFFGENGKVFHDDSVYDARMTYFFDCLLFERSLPGGSSKPLCTPFEHLVRLIEEHPVEYPEMFQRRLRGLGDFRHSLFQIAKLSERAIVLQDVLNGDKIKVQARAGETFRALERKTLVQGFVYPVDGVQYLSQGLLLHPQRASRVIRRLLKQAQKAEGFSRKSFLCRLAALQIRFFRHRHVDPRTIYQADPR